MSYFEPDSITAEAAYRRDALIEGLARARASRGRSSWRRARRAAEPRTAPRS